MKRVTSIAVALLLLVVTACSSDPTTSDDYEALEQEVAQANRELAQANRELAQAEGLLAGVTAERDAAVALNEIIEEATSNETAHFEAFLAKDLDALTDTYTEDVIWVDETYGDYIEGKDAVRGMLSNVIKFTDPNASGVLNRFISEDGTRAASTWEWTGTNFFGRSFDLPFALIDEYRDGKIVKQTIYYASPNAREQLLGS